MGKAISNTIGQEVKPVPTAIIEANKTDLQPGTMTDWSRFSLPHLLVNVPRFAEAYQLPVEDFEVACHGSAALRAENKAIAGTLSAALDKNSMYVANFKQSLLAIDATAAASGYKLLHAILSSEECGKGIYRIARIKEFKAKQFFNDTDTVEKVVAASNKALAEFKLLPESERAESNAEIKMLLSKMPIAIEEQVAHYKMKIEKREARDMPLKFTYSELTVMLAVDIIAVYINKPGPAGTSRAITTTGKKPFVRQCMNCGSFDHIVSDKLCTKRCPNKSCNSKICPNVRGGTCVVAADTIPERSEIKNAAGATVPEHVYDWLVELREKQRPKMTNKSASTSMDGAPMTTNALSML